MTSSEDIGKFPFHGHLRLRLGDVNKFTFLFVAKNIFDSRYELVSGYPMPGRSFIGGIGFTF